MVSTGLHPLRAPHQAPKCVPNQKFDFQAKVPGQASRPFTERMVMCFSQQSDCFLEVAADQKLSLHLL